MIIFHGTSKVIGMVGVFRPALSCTACRSSSAFATCGTYTASINGTAPFPASALALTNGASMAGGMAYPATNWKEASDGWTQEGQRPVRVPGLDDW